MPLAISFLSPDFVFFTALLTTGHYNKTFACLSHSIPLLECELSKGRDSVLFSNVPTLLGLCLPHHWDSDCVTGPACLGLLKGWYGERQTGESLTFVVLSHFIIAALWMWAHIVPILQVNAGGSERLLKTGSACLRSKSSTDDDDGLYSMSPLPGTGWVRVKCSLSPTPLFSSLSGFLGLWG